MTAPLDEDAAALAQIVRAAATALDDATQPDVGYPGLRDPQDATEVLEALADLTGRLQQTLAHLGRFLDEELEAGRLTGAGDSTGAGAVAATRRGLQEAHRAAGHLSAGLLGAASASAGTAAAD